MKLDADSVRFFGQADVKLPKIRYAGPERAWKVAKWMEVAVVDTLRKESTDGNDAYGETYRV